MKSSKPASRNQSHGIPMPNEWGLGGIERVDVNQADISPLMVFSLPWIICLVYPVILQFKIHSSHTIPFFLFAVHFAWSAISCELSWNFAS